MPDKIMSPKSIMESLYEKAYTNGIQRWDAVSNMTNKEDDVNKSLTELQRWMESEIRKVETLRYEYQFTFLINHLKEEAGK